MAYFSFHLIPVIAAHGSAISHLERLGWESHTIGQIFLYICETIKILAMRIVELHIPDEVDLKDYDFSMIIASKLYEDGKLSSGQAAEMAGLTKRTFIELLGRYGVSVFRKSLSGSESDIANA